MPVYKFKAEKPNGEIYEARQAAPDKFALYKNVKSAGDTVIFAEEMKIKHFMPAGFLRGLFSKVSTREKVMFARNLGSMLEAGLPLSRALSVIERQTKKKPFKKVIQKIIDEISAGRSLSESLKVHPAIFSELFTSMVRAGEESGSLPASLKNIANQMNAVYQIQRKVKGAMIYPAIIVGVIIIIAIIMLIYVVPTISAIFKDLKTELPWNTRVLIFTSDFIKHNLVLFLSGIVGIALAFSFVRRTTSGKNAISFVVLKIPVISNIIKESNSARTARTLSSLFAAGVEVVEALEITAAVVQNIFYRKVLRQAQEKIKKGETMSSVFSANVNLYPVFVGEMVAIGEETGQLGHMLSNVADFYEGEVEQKTKDMSTIIEPFLMVVIGVAVGFFALSIISPMYSLVNAI